MSLEKTVVFEDTVIAASGTISSSWIPLYASHQYQGLNGKFTGSGTVTLSYQLSSVDSPDDNVFATSEGNIATGVTAGAYHYDIAPKVSRYIRIVATETGGVSTALSFSANFIQQGRGY